MVQPIGYFKLWRELLTKPIWLNSTPEQKTIIITLLAMANFNDKEWEWKGEKFKADRGHFITSLDSIARNCGKGITIQNVRTALKRFEKMEFLTNESTKTGRLITIVNWHVYQSSEDEPNKDDNKDLTKTQQRPNKDLTPREEGKKDKKDIYTPEFENVWSFYPNPNGKRESFDKYKKLIKQYTDEQLIEAIKVYAKEVKGEEKKFIKHGSTFFNKPIHDYIEKLGQEKAKPHRKELKPIIVKARSASDE